ncbi:hypothetical protein GCM10027598_80780 [Amycolatopsis oliviviridis]
MRAFDVDVVLAQGQFRGVAGTEPDESFLLPQVVQHDVAGRPGTRSGEEPVGAGEDAGCAGQLVEIEYGLVPEFRSRLGDGVRPGR